MDEENRVKDFGATNFTFETPTYANEYLSISSHTQHHSKTHSLSFSLFQPPEKDIQAIGHPPTYTTTTYQRTPTNTKTQPVPVS